MFCVMMTPSYKHIRNSNDEQVKVFLVIKGVIANKFYAYIMDLREKEVKIKSLSLSPLPIAHPFILPILAEKKLLS